MPEQENFNKEPTAMKIEILTKNVNDEKSVREYIKQKVHFAMDRIDSRIDQVTVRLEDETKDSAAFDGVCRIEIDMHPRGHIHISANGESTHDCILQAVRKMEHAVKHDIDRHRRSSKIRHQNGKQEFFDSLPTEIESVVEENPEANPDE